MDMPRCNPLHLLADFSSANVALTCRNLLGNGLGGWVQDYRHMSPLCQSRLPEERNDQHSPFGAGGCF
jgi:hypothetical protein